MEEKMILESTHIIKSKIFNTEEEAKKWYDFEKVCFDDKDFDVFEPEEGEDPAISKMEDGRWEAFIEAGTEIYEADEVPSEA